MLKITQRMKDVGNFVNVTSKKWYLICNSIHNISQFNIFRPQFNIIKSQSNKFKSQFNIFKSPFNILQG